VSLYSISNEWLELEVIGAKDTLWSYKVKETGEVRRFGPPAFEVDGELCKAELAAIEGRGSKRLSNGVTEYMYEGLFNGSAELTLEMIFRLADDNPVVRFCYLLRSVSERRLTKAEGKDRLIYLEADFDRLPKATEVRLAEFLEPVHSFSLSELPVSQSHYDNELAVMGPILAAQSDTHAMLLAYEHGSQVPDAFIQFQLGKGHSVRVEAVKGNYYSGQTIGPGRPYRTIWLQAAVVKGSEDDLAKAYRTFVLKYMSVNQESRRPYIYYNTWNYQERNFNWHGNKYLDSMHQERILEEIDSAHRMGIEVFVIDTGWYRKTGDWLVNTDRFPDGLSSVKRKLDEYGMKLGLWFGPTSAAVTSKMFEENRDNTMTWNGNTKEPHSVWETEESHGMCLVSPYSDAFADKLIELVRELGVTYFKWDAIGQYGCNDPHHWHGTEENSEQERADSYAFQIGLEMTRIVERVTEACPEAIVDFDVTEGSRYVGLGFLSAGKYFLINNGPYWVNYDFPNAVDNKNWNLFFYPGPARTWICRTPLVFDKWIPSVLFLTHYLPDDPGHSQLINIGSLILGHNGIWGDLPAISEEGIQLHARILGLYKQVREDITRAAMIRTGTVGGNPEIYEKIAEDTGRGCVVIFASSFGKPFSKSLTGKYTYVTAHKVAPEIWHNEGVSVRTDHEGRAVIEVAFEEAGAKIIYFGATE
jgi:alpha-galactosidase